MKWKRCLPAVSLVAGFALAVSFATPPSSYTYAESRKAGRGWISLFNGKDLTGWESYQGKPYGSQQLLGLNNDPRGVFTVVQMDGEPAIRVSGEVLGALTTLKEYGDYWLRLQFKWGEKKWPPAEKAQRNSGILYHCVGPHGAIAEMCMQSHECQIKEKETGDYWSSNVIVDAVGDPSNDPAKVPQRFRPGGTKFTVFDPNGDRPGRIVFLADYEKPVGDWNTVEVVCLGQTAIHAVNGHNNMMITGSRMKKDGGEIPLVRGKLQLLSEYAEVFYRRIELRHIREIPGRFSRWVTHCMSPIGKPEGDYCAEQSG